MLKTILERKKEEGKVAELEKRREELAEIEKEERELEVAIEELDPEADESDKKIIEEMVDDLTDRKEEVGKAVKILEDEIQKIDETIAELEKKIKNPPADPQPADPTVEVIEEGQRGAKRGMRRDAFKGMNMREIREFTEREDVKNWLGNVRAWQKRER